VGIDVDAMILVSLDRGGHGDHFEPKFDTF
jgi:hypothetical protein